MAERSGSPARATARRCQLSVEVVAFTPHGGELTALLRRTGRAGRERHELPWEALRPGEQLDVAAARLARGTLGAAPAHLEQAGAVGDGRRHPGDAFVSVGYFALVPAASRAATVEQANWFPVSALPSMPPRHATVVERALQALRSRLDDSPVAFRLLPPAFTLTQLQEIYETLLGYPLHKASFRRSLQAAYLVEPIDEWRSEGRGRPAQLFRYAPRKRKEQRRGVRFG